MTANASARAKAQREIVTMRLQKEQAKGGKIQMQNLEGGWNREESYDASRHLGEYQI